MYSLSSYEHWKNKQDRNLSSCWCGGVLEAICQFGGILEATAGRLPQNRQKDKFLSLFVFVMFVAWQRGHSLKIYTLFCIVNLKSILFNLLCMCFFSRMLAVNSVSDFFFWNRRVKRLKKPQGKTAVLHKHHLPVSGGSSLRPVSPLSCGSVSSLGVSAALISSSVGRVTSSVGSVDKPSSVAGGMVVVSSADWAANSSSLMVSSTRCRLVLRMLFSSPATSSLGDVSFDSCKDSCHCHWTMWKLRANTFISPLTMISQWE